jgi:hypothetical protein
MYVLAWPEVKINMNRKEDKLQEADYSAMLANLEKHQPKAA